MKKVGLVSNNKYLNKISEDLTLKKTLTNDGINAEIISWEYPNNNYYAYDCLIVRSVWGYHNNYPAFKKWLQFIKDMGIPIYNSTDIIQQNIRKDLQFDILDRNGISHVDTIFQKGTIDYSMVGENKVIKPIISGGGDNTYKSDEVNLHNLESIIKEEENGIMIQPYEKAIEKGEFSIIYIDGENTHNMIRFPGVLYKKAKPYEIKDIPNSIIELANQVKNIPEYKDVLYMRVDIIDEDNPKVMEVELTEPDLLTRNIVSTEPIKKLSRGIRRRI